jgi:hypothetical protein
MKEYVTIYGSLSVPFPCSWVAHNISAGSSGIQRWYFHFLVMRTQHPQLVLRASHQVPASLLIQWRDSPLLECRWASLSYTKEPRKGSGTYWEPHHQTGKNPDSNNKPAFGRQKGSLSTPQRLSNNPVWVEPGSLRFMEWDKNVWDLSGN